MNVVEELMAQRDAVMFGTWVQGPPLKAGEACAVVRFTDDGAFVELQEAAGWVLKAFRKLHPDSERRYAWDWNDSGEATREQVLEVLDEAIRMAKEADDRGGA